MASSHDLMRDPLFRYLEPGGRLVETSLPGVLSGLAREGVQGFPHLRAHQAPAWHAFLVQLAALALHRAGESTPPRDEADWAHLLLALTGGDAVPWCLVVSDPAQAAFLQPPTPKGDLSAYKREIPTPDALDVLVTSRNHDLKLERVAAARPEHWIYALVCLQTTEGFLGRGNYGILRMNGGFASRPFVSTTPGRGPGARFRRDLVALASVREKVAIENEYPAEGGHGLLWLLPWDGEHALSASACDPWFIEVCRRIRMTVRHAGLVALMAPTASARLAGRANGLTGDPWAPLDGGKSLTVGAAGFSYGKLHKLLFASGDTRPAPIQLPIREDGEDPVFMASALVRGQGKTEGFHHREIPIPTRVARRLPDPDERARLGAIAEQWVEAAGTIRKSVLHPALCCLIQAAPTKIDFKDDRTQPFTQRFDKAVDDAFFPALLAQLDASPSPGALSHAWAGTLRDLAWNVLVDAFGRVPVPSIRRSRAEVMAERMFKGSLRKHFPDLTTPGEQDDTESSTAAG